MNKDELIKSVEADLIKDDIPNFSPGDIIRVYEKVFIEGESGDERTQVFEGLVLRRSGGGTGEMFTIRKDSFGIGIEKVLPVNSPRIEKIEIVKKGSVHQARPNYLRRKTKRKPKRRAATDEEKAVSRRKIKENKEVEETFPDGEVGEEETEKDE